MTHYLKIWPEHFRDVVSGKKKVEIRSEEDRAFIEDDILIMREWNEETQEYTGNEVTVKVTHCLRGLPFVPEGYVAMSIRMLWVSNNLA